MPTVDSASRPHAHRLTRLLGAAGVIAAASASVVGAAGVASAAGSADVVISQVYGGGGNSGATYTNDFIELFNNSQQTVSIDGWSVQYASATGTAYQVTAFPSGAQIGPDAYYLIQEAAGAAGTTALPAAEATGTINMSSTAGKVALVTNSTALAAPTSATGGTIHDYVGYGSTANLYEGTGPAPTLTNTTSDTRTPTGTDSNDNSKDFTAGTVTPHNSTSSAGTGGGTTSGCTAAGTTAIDQIEGAAITSPLAGTSVSCVPGIVTATKSGGYWVQAATPGDSDPNTSEGLYVFGGTIPAVGASVLVSGKVANYAAGYSDDYQLNLELPELTSPTVVTLSSNNPLPAPVLLGNAAGDQLPPRENISSDTGDLEASGMAFNRTTDALDFYRSLYAMRVQVRDARVTGPNATAGHGPVVVPGDGVDSGLATPPGGVLYDTYADPNPRALQLYDAAISGGIPAASVGDTASSAVIGILDFFGNPELQVTAAPTFVAGPLTPGVTTLVPRSGSQLSVATYNVENLNPQAPASKFQALAGQILNNLKSPDLIAVEEVQDNSGVTDDGTVSASTTLSMLTSAISTAGGPTYSTTEIDPTNDADGGEPGGNIRQVFLYNPAFITLVSKPGGGTTTADSVVTNPDGTTGLAQSPGRIDPTNSAWNASRKPLAAEFTLNATGATFFAIGNHFVAKLGDAPLFARTQPPAMSSAQQRIAQATEVNNFVSQLEADPNANVLVMGDFNDYTFSSSQQTLRGTQLRDLFGTLPANQQYDYVFDGDSQTLDHILVSGPLFAGASFSPVHVNAEFANQTSDHDPEVALTAPAATPSLPESPVALLLPLVGLVMLAGASGFRRRRRGLTAS